MFIRFNCQLFIYPLGTHVGILSFSSGITRRHQISGTQDVSIIQRAVDEIQRGIGQPVMYRAFSVATGDVGEHRPQKDLKRLLVVASNGRYIRMSLLFLKILI